MSCGLARLLKDKGEEVRAGDVQSFHRHFQKLVKLVRPALPMPHVPLTAEREVLAFSKVRRKKRTTVPGGCNPPAGIFADAALNLRAGEFQKLGLCT